MCIVPAKKINQIWKDVTGDELKWQIWYVWLFTVFHFV